MELIQTCSPSRTPTVGISLRVLNHRVTPAGAAVALRAMVDTASLIKPVASASHPVLSFKIKPH